MTQDPLLAMIDEAFDPNSAPLRVTTVACTPYDEGLDDQFLGTSWRDHSPESLECAAPLPFFTPEGFAYFLPAYLRAARLCPHSGIVDSLVAQLLPPKGNLNRASFRAWWSLLSLQQQRVVIAFLNAHIDTQPFEIADFVSKASRSTGQ